MKLFQEWDALNICEFGMAPALKKIIESLNSDDPKTKIKAIREIADQKLVECLSDLARLLEKDSPDDVKVEAIRAMGKIQDSAAGPYLLPFLPSDDVELAMESIQALGILGSGGFTDGVLPLEQLLESPKFRIRKYAIMALGECGTSATLETLYEHFKRDETSLDEKELIAEAIGKIGGGRALQILKNLIIPTEEIPELQMEIRRTAIQALGNIQRSARLEVLGQVYNNKTEHKVVRKYAEDAIQKTIEGAKARYLQTKSRAEEILKGKA